MANTVRIKRRATGAAGAPANLQNAELAFNEVDNTLYYGFGTGGTGGSATTVNPIGGPGAFVDRTSAQSVAGQKDFSTSPTAPTPTAGDTTTKVATTAFVQNAIALPGNVSANAVLAGPATSGTGTPTYRALVSNDIPSLLSTKISDIDAHADAHADARIALQKGANNGLATLDNGGKVPASQLPSYVDDVLEYSSLSAFPATGETGKIYTALDAGKIYRWSGSTYVNIAASPGSTDSIAEGSLNLYFTETRVRASALTGLALSNAVLAATDSVIAAFGKLQAQVSNRLTYNDVIDGGTF